MIEPDSPIEVTLMKPNLIMLVFLSILAAGCSDAIRLANYDLEDSPDDSALAQGATAAAPELLSAFFGLNSEAPLMANFFVCRGTRGRDASPVVFPTELNLDTLQAGDFKVVRADGTAGTLHCVTPAPAFDIGELRTMLMVGDYGSTENPPVRVEIVGNLLSQDNRINYRGRSVAVVPLVDGPSMVLAEVIPADEWELGKKPTFMPFGGGSGCPEGTRQIVRVTWNGGITKPGGSEVDDLERTSYAITMRDDDGKESTIVPYALGDLGDGDNNHKLCLDVDGSPVRITFPGGLVTDPREDLNPPTAIEVTTPHAG